MTEFVISDTHWHHDNIIGYCDRPKDYESLMSKNLICLKEDDILYHLGDICMGDNENVHDTFIKPLRCKKILIRGNHDKKSDTWYRKHGWDFVCDGLTMKKYGAVVCMSHEPRPWDGFYDLNIHGHLHNLSHVDEYKYLRMWHFLISMENNSYKPYSFKDVVGKFRSLKDKTGG